MGSCDKNKRRICAEKGEDISVIKEEKGRSARVHQRVIEEEIY